MFGAMSTSFGFETGSPTKASLIDTVRSRTSSPRSGSTDTRRGMDNDASPISPASVKTVSPRPSHVVSPSSGLLERVRMYVITFLLFSVGILNPVQGHPPTTPCVRRNPATLRVFALQNLVSEYICVILNDSKRRNQSSRTSALVVWERIQGRAWVRETRRFAESFSDCWGHLPKCPTPN